MPPWTGRFLALAFLAFGLGFAAGHFAGAAWGAAAALAPVLAVLAFHLRERERLKRRLADPDGADPSDAHGTWGDIQALLHRLLREQSRTRASLSHALWRFRQAAEAMPEGVMVLDGTDRIEWMNPAAEGHFGLTVKGDRQQVVTNLIRHPSFGDYLAARNWGEPLVLKGPSEGDRILLVMLVPYGRDEKLLLSRDVTRWERLEAVRRDFVANVSHELRTPLTVLKGFLETMTDADPGDEKTRQRALALMTDQADRMQRLVEDLLMLSRLEDSRYPLKEEPVDVAALCAAIVAEGENLSAGRHRLTLAAAPQRLTGSREELRSAFTNLVTNAVRYTPPGGAIAVEWSVAGGEPVLRVTDQGEGIAPEHIPRLTERFYRIDRGRSRATGGTGLGLAIVKHVMARHQGRLEIESEIGKGSTFACRFPATRLAPPAADERAA